MDYISLLFANPLILGIHCLPGLILWPSIKKPNGCYGPYSHSNPSPPSRPAVKHGLCPLWDSIITYKVVIRLIPPWSSQIDSQCWWKKPMVISSSPGVLSPIEGPQRSKNLPLRNGLSKNFPPSKYSSLSTLAVPSLNQIIASLSIGHHMERASVHIPFFYLRSAGYLPLTIL